MKNLALVGMMFLSIGLFAQSSEAEVPVKEKDKVCVKKCDKEQKCDKMKKAPIQRVDERKSSVRSGNGSAVGNHQHAKSRKMRIQKGKMIAPLTRKSAKVEEKM